MANYEIWLLSDAGSRLLLLDRLHSLEYSQAVNEVGAIIVGLPDDFDETYLAADRIIEVWRQPEGGMLALEHAYFIRRWIDRTDGNGKRTLEVHGVGGNDLLARRIVAYTAGSAQAQQTDQADDMCKVIVRQNMGASVVDTARDWDSTLFTVQGDLAAGPSMTKGFAWRRVIDILQDIAQAARTAGTRVYWDVVPLAAGAFEFRTYGGQRGLDRTYPSGSNPILFGLEYGNLSEAQVDRDYSDEVTFVYGEGQGEGADRIQQTAEDTARSGRSIWGRREALADGRNESATAGVLAGAQARLDEGRPKIRFSGRLVDSAATKYGRDWWFGDKLTAVYRGQMYSAQARVVHISVDGDGKETIEARLETDE